MRALWIDDSWPRMALGAGHPRGLALLQALAACCDEIVVCPTQSAPAADLVAGAPAGIRWSRLPPPFTAAGLANWLGREEPFDLLWVGRPHNMALVADARRVRPEHLAATRIVYDAEAVFALRALRRRALDGNPASDVKAAHVIRNELYPVAAADAAVAVSAAEAELIARHTRLPVTVLAHAAPPVPAAVPFSARGGLLFVGPVEPALEPNGDSLRWFLQQVTPAFAAPRPALTIVGRGSGAGSWLAPLLGPGDAGLGAVDDLTPHYARARVFVAPTRFAAGIPLKVIDAARHGVPVVATTLLAGQLGWKPGVELLAEDDPARFAAAVAMLHDDPALWVRIRDAALGAVVRDFDPAGFAATVRAVAHGQPAEPAGRVLH